jgi:glycerol-3-phosphate cytidylyltransferase
MKKVITYGTFDLFHQGHYNLLKRAKDLGDWLIVGVTTDNFDLARGKMNTCDNMMDRIEAVRNTGLADQIIIEEYKGQKIDDIQKYGVDIFAIGSDWTGYFDYLKEYCQVVYLPRTEGISSTILREGRPAISLGIIGTGDIAGRFIPESKFVNSIPIAAAFDQDPKACSEFCRTFAIPVAAGSLDELYQNCSAVYIASAASTHYEYVKSALEAGKHVLCETPFVFKLSEAQELYEIAESKNLVLMVALKTAYCPAFGHLVTLLKSGAIGEVVEVSASISGRMNEQACFPLLPIFKLLGTDYRDLNFYTKIDNGVDVYTKALFRYDSAVALFQLGLGTKSEGNLVISGTKGYAYIPAPWWKTDYYEIRYEDPNQNKKYFYPFAGEGLRYEIKEFVSAILADGRSYSKISKKENLGMAQVQEAYLNHSNVFHLNPTCGK